MNVKSSIMPPTTGYIRRSNRIPAKRSKIPIIAITPVSKLFCKMFSMSIVSVIIRAAIINIMNPMKDMKPPRAILNRCFGVKFGIVFLVS